MTEATQHTSSPSSGRVTLVGFGPGDPDLLTIKGDKALRKADIIFFDDLTNRDFLEQYTAEKVYVGKRSGRHSHQQDEINELIFQAAASGKDVVRLKGGDPMIFAHGREEIDYLKSRGVVVEVVPGISSGIAMASLTQIPLTHRGLSQSVAFVLGHTATGKKHRTPTAETLIYYMGGSQVAHIAQALIADGRDADTPVAIVSNVSLPNQFALFSTLAELRYGIYTTTPVLIVVGRVVALEAEYHNQPKLTVTGQPADLDALGNYPKLFFPTAETVRSFRTLAQNSIPENVLLAAANGDAFAELEAWRKDNAGL